MKNVVKFALVTVGAYALYCSVFRPVKLSGFGSVATKAAALRSNKVVAANKIAAAKLAQQQASANAAQAQQQAAAAAIQIQQQAAAQAQAVAAQQAAIRAAAIQAAVARSAVAWQQHLAQQAASYGIQCPAGWAIQVNMDATGYNPLPGRAGFSCVQSV